MKKADRRRFSSAVVDWRIAKEKFGTHRVVFGLDSLASVDPKLIWTAGNRGADDQYITNEFLEIDNRSFYIIEKPYTEPEGEIVLHLTLLLECECEAENPDCKVCNGHGTFEMEVPIP